MADIERVQSIIADFRRRMQKNGSTSKAKWNAFTSMPTLSPVQLTRRLNSYGIQVTNQDVSAVWRFVGIKTNSMTYDDFVRMLTMDLDDVPRPAAKKKPAKVARQAAEDAGGEPQQMKRPRLGMAQDEKPKKGKPHVTIDQKFIKQAKAAKRPHDDGEGESLYQMAPKKAAAARRQDKSGIDEDLMQRGTYGEDDDDEEPGYARRPALGGRRYEDDDDDEDYAPPPTKGRPSLGGGRYEDDDEDDDYAPPQKGRPALGGRRYEDEDDDDEDYAPPPSKGRPALGGRRYEDEDDDDYQHSPTKAPPPKGRQNINDDDDERAPSRGSRGSNRKSQDPEIFSSVPSSNVRGSPKYGGRGHLDPDIFGRNEINDSQSNLLQEQQEQDLEDKYNKAEPVSGLSLQNMISMISEHVYNAYPNSKTCYHKWRGFHNNLEASDLRDGLAKDGNILITLEDAKNIIAKYGGPLSLSAFARLLSDGTKFADEAKSGPQEMTEDEAAIVNLAKQVRGNQWENMIFRAPDVADIVRGFAELGIKVDPNDIRILTQKLGKSGLVNAIKANM